MSFSKPVKKQTGRVTGKTAKNMKPSSPQAKHSVESSHHRKSHGDSPGSKQPQPDSGFFDGSDGELYGDAGGNSFAYNYGNNKDWNLYDDDQVFGHDEGYYFSEDDAVDIASTKANHGSLYNGKNNEDNTLAMRRSESSSPALEVIHENPQGSDPPHRFTYHPTTQYEVNQLQTWTRTFEQHESIAYRFEQPPNPSHVFHGLQSWHEDIDLDVYAVLF